MDEPLFDQDPGNSFSEKQKRKKLPPKKRFRINSSPTAWKPDPRQQLILDNLWTSIKNPQKGEEIINALVLHMEELCTSKATLQQELCLKIDSLQHELSLQKAQTHDFLQNRVLALVRTVWGRSDPTFAGVSSEDSVQGIVFEHPTELGNHSGGWTAKEKHLEGSSEL
ncbi:hypothetical protein CRG98_039614 [Punica granatum]|uniref:Uncharacterized protein n=1 Tax=Punica granatum TaxID=22663 RepID=A0A2I0I7K1_PUNGR|nr:hypothetical protein CRG98_039614 [Punica granatum]